MPHLGDLMIYVLNQDGKPLMPTQRHGKVKHLLRSGKAKVVKRCPFTIQLLYESTQYVQPVVLGVDPGSKFIGLSATTAHKDGGKELYAAEVELRLNICNLLAERKKIRSNRRLRTRRHRKARFSNRASKKKGWLSPMFRNKLQVHEKAIANVCKIVPVSQINVELGSFDIQKMKNPQIKHDEYACGEQQGFNSLRQYILFRDDYSCQICAGASGDKRLEIHHIESRRTGGNAPNNLVTLCSTCHKQLHDGKIALPEHIKRGESLRDAAHMNYLNVLLSDSLSNLYPDKLVFVSYLQTVETREKFGLEKSHCVDARCISGNPLATPLGGHYRVKRVRSHNRQLHRIKFSKGGKRLPAKAPKYVFNYRVFDKVLYDGQECFIFGRCLDGSFQIRLIDGTIVAKSKTFRKLKLLERSTTSLTAWCKDEV